MQHLKGVRIKQLNTMIAKAKLERVHLSEEFSTLQSKMDKTNNTIKKYEDELAKLTVLSDSLVVSEHAILRYLERVYKLDLLKIEEEIASPSLYEKVQILGSGTYSCDDDYSAKVVDGIIVTILPNDKSLQRKATKARNTKVKLDKADSLKEEVAAYYEEK